MVASVKTVDLVLSYATKYMAPDQLAGFIKDLRTVPGNQSFLDTIELLEKRIGPPKEPINNLGILGSVKFMEFYEKDGVTKAGGGNISFGFGEYRQEGKHIGVSGGRYITCGIPSGYTPTQLATQLRKMADHVEASASKEW